MTSNYLQKSKLRERKQKADFCCLFFFFEFSPSYCRWKEVGVGSPSLCCHASVRSSPTLVRCDCRSPGKMSRCRAPGANPSGGGRRMRSNIFPPFFYLFIERLPCSQQSAPKKKSTDRVSSPLDV